MIDYQILNDGGVFVRQTPREKTLYLDVWFWSRLAKSKELREKFICRASKTCTIMYSIGTMMELATIRHPQQLSSIREVMDAVDFGFIESDPNAVISLERKHENTVGSGVFSGRHPASDHDVLGHLIKSKYPNTDLHMSDLFTELLGELPVRYHEIANRFARTMNGLIRKARKSKSYQEMAKQRRRRKHPTRTGPPYTEDVLQRFLDYVATSKSLLMTRNDWMDMLHLIVPLSYLSIVLTDGRWLHFVRSELQLSNRELAQVYGPREIEGFLSAL